MPFEEFDKRAATASKAPLVTIQRQGPFSFNKAAYELLGNPEAVRLFFDKEEQIIGFAPASVDHPRAYPIRPQGDRSVTYMVAGKAFTQHYGIDASVARRYGVQARDDMVVLDLKSESVDVTGPRLKRQNQPADESAAAR